MVWIKVKVWLNRPWFSSELLVTIAETRLLRSGRYLQRQSPGNFSRVASPLALEFNQIISRNVQISSRMLPSESLA